MNREDAIYMTAVEHARGFIMDAARGEEGNQTLGLFDIVERVEVTIRWRERAKLRISRRLSVGRSKKRKKFWRSVKL